MIQDGQTRPDETSLWGLGHVRKLTLPQAFIDNVLFWRSGLVGKT